MNEKQLKHYHAFCNDLWRFFRKYSDQGITDVLIWQAVHDAGVLKADHADCIGRKALVDDVVRQLQEIAERMEPEQDPAQRLKDFFNDASTAPASQHLWDVVGTWMDWFTGIHPEYADDVIDRLRILLGQHGHHIGFDELKDYAGAGWSVALREGES